MGGPGSENDYATLIFSLLEKARPQSEGKWKPDKRDANDSDG